MNRVKLLLLLLCMLLCSAGTWTSHNFLYQPGLGASGQLEWNNVQTGYGRVDQRLGYVVYVGDPGYTTFASAVTAIGSTPATLVLPSGNHVGDNLTVPDSLTLKILQGGIITVATGTTCTINGPLEAGLYQIFSLTGTGKVDFGIGAGSRLYPQWWGADDTGVSDCATAVQACIEAAASSPERRKVDFGTGAYRLDSGITWYVDHMSLVGSAMLDFTHLASGNYAITATAKTVGSGDISQTRVVNNTVSYMDGLNIAGPIDSSITWDPAVPPDQPDGILGYVANTGIPATENIVQNVTFRNVSIHGFRRGVQLGNRANTWSFIRCHIWRCWACLYVDTTGLTGAGQAHFTDGELMNCCYPLWIYGGSDYYLVNVNIDNPVRVAYLAYAQLYLLNCHVEFGTVPTDGYGIHLGKNARFSMRGGTYTQGNAAYQNEYVVYFDGGNATDDAQSTADFDNVYIYGIQPTSGYFSGVRGSNDANSITYLRQTRMLPTSGNSWILGALYRFNCLFDGNMDSSAINDNIFITVDGTVSPIANRQTGTNITLTKSTVEKHSGTRSLNYSGKVASKATEMVIAVPVRPGDLMQYRAYDYMPTAAPTAGTLTISAGFGTLDNLNVNSVPILRGFVAVNTATKSLANPWADWILRTFGTTSDIYKAPQWATHFVVKYGVDSAVDQPFELYIDDVSIDKM